MSARIRKRPERLLAQPAIIMLLVWMIVPLAMTLYFSTQYYNLLYPGKTAFVGLENFAYFFTYPSFWTSVLNTIILVGSVLVVTVVGGVLVSVLVDETFPGQGIVRMLLISPFFIMPTVAALVWKNLLMNPVSGFLAWVWKLFGATPVNWFADWPLFSIITVVSWEWLPFAILIFVTALQSLDREQMEAARMDGASTWRVFWSVIFPLLMPMNATVGILTCVWAWNDFIMPLVVLTSPSARTLPLAQYVFQGQFNTDYTVAFASYLMAMAPLLIAYTFSQRWVISGVTRGSIK